MDAHDGPTMFEPLPAPELDDVHISIAPPPLDDNLILGSQVDSPTLGPPNLPLHPAEEKQLVQDKEREEAGGLQAGREYYLISRKWYVEWLQWVGHHSVQSPKIGPSAPPLNVKSSLEVIREDASPHPPSPARSSSFGGSSSLRKFSKERPGPIDNRTLLEEEYVKGEVLKRDIVEHQDYDIVSEGVWDLLSNWYGGGPAIKRLAVQPPKGGNVFVELYGLRLQVYKSSELHSKAVEMIESKFTTVEVFKKKACEEFKLEYSKVRIWDYFKMRKQANLEQSLTSSLEDSRIFDDNDILLEEQNADGSWPETTSGYRYSSYSSYDFNSDVSTTGTPMEAGAVGLQNLGNTCFMNSSLQCLSHVRALREFFVDEAYKDDLNADAFKTAGKLAEAFAKLLRLMWNPETTQVAPRNFKWQIGQFAEQFAGYGQQDSMEFIEYVLDGLKEDVNKVKGPKPFVELKEADGREDQVVADEARHNYLQRNNSRIDELFLGFFKSTVTCPQPNCGRVSVTFDPFLSVKLSLVSTAKEKQTTLEVTVVPIDGQVKLYQATVSKFGNADDIIEAAASQAGIDPKRCLLAEVYMRKLYKFFNANDSVESSIKLNDILVLYELENVSEFQITSSDTYGYSSSYYSSSLYNNYSSSIASTPPSLSQEADDNTDDKKIGFVLDHRKYLEREFGLPFLTVHDRRTTGAALIEAVEKTLQRHMGKLPDVEWKLMDNYREILPADDLSFDRKSAQVHLQIEWEQKPEELEALQRVYEDGKDRRYKQPGIALGKCLELFTESDQLDEADAWYCNRCKQHRQAFKKMDFWSLPPVLVLQLKRFVYTQYSRDRLDTPVEFPLEGLDLRPFAQASSPASSSMVYDLAAVSKHMGGLGGGHYVAYARSSETGKWYYFNDSSVTLVDASTVAEEQVGAYVLFYLRRDQRPPGWGPPADEAM
mmetsp:Transcript_30500/g.55691  ORF Transcript_30500/g.55691 Transcript_30500/m.55691 type:complete len:937 (+) Transcript_30500:223-3033(+)